MEHYLQSVSLILITAVLGILLRGQMQEKLLLNRHFRARIAMLTEPELIGIAD